MFSLIKTLSFFCLLALFPMNLLAVTPSALSVQDGSLHGNSVSAQANLHYETYIESTRISREYLCLASQNPSLCPFGNQIILGREFDATKIRHAMVLDTRVSFWDDIELGVSLPVVLQEQVSIQYAAGVGPGNSTLANNQLVAIPFYGPVRAGLGDPTFHFRVAPSHHDSGDVVPALVFDLAYTAPLSPTIAAGNAAVGEGLNQINIAITSGYPVREWFEPYVSIATKLRYAAGSSLYVRGFNTQTLNDPGAQLLLRAGLGFTPWEKGAKDYLEVSVEGYARYTFEGREPTIMFDAIGTSFCNLDSDPAGTLDGRCPMTAYPFNPLGLAQHSNGVTDIEARATFGGKINAHYRVFEHFQFFATLAVDYSTPYFLTYSIAGRDLDGNGFIESGSNEFSPVYAPEMDDKGKRIKATQTISFLGQTGVRASF